MWLDLFSLVFGGYLGFIVRLMIRGGRSERFYRGISTA